MILLKVSFAFYFVGIKLIRYFRLLLRLYKRQEICSTLNQNFQPCLNTNFKIYSLMADLLKDKLMNAFNTCKCQWCLKFIEHSLNPTAYFLMVVSKYVPKRHSLCIFPLHLYVSHQPKQLLHNLHVTRKKCQN